MVKDLCIDIEREFKIVVKKEMVLLFIASEIMHDGDASNSFKNVKTNVSLINNMDYGGPQISKIGGSGRTMEEAYANCIKAFNDNATYHAEENKILLCCADIPEIEQGDLKPFEMTRTIRFSWRFSNKTFGLLNVYVRKDGDRLAFTHDGTEDTLYAQSDEEIIDYVLANCNFDVQPTPTSRRRNGRLFFPTSEEMYR